MRVSVLVLLSMCLMANGSNPTPTRKPDVESKRAKVEDYYTYDKESGQWIWSEDYPEFVKRRNQAKLKKKQELDAKKNQELEDIRIRALEDAQQNELQVNETQDDPKDEITQDQPIPLDQGDVGQDPQDDKQKDKAKGFWETLWDNFVAILEWIASIVLRVLRAIRDLFT